MHEDDVSVPMMTFKLGAVQAEMMDLVKKLCEPLFIIFDYEVIPDDIYRQIVTDFINGIIR